jgi:hypothetical protein
VGQVAYYSQSNDEFWTTLLHTSNFVGAMLLVYTIRHDFFFFFFPFANWTF